jgi:hypothetical protein
LCAATCEVVWLRRLLQDVGKEQKEPTMIKCDNQSSIKLANNPIFHARTKHVDAQFHFVREELQSNEIALMYCNTCEMLLIFSLSLLERLSLSYLGRC